MRVLAFAASLRRESYNRKLLEVAVRLAEDNGAQLDLAEFREFDMPLYNDDVRTEQGWPPGCEELKRRLDGCQAFMIASPEYNHSIPGPLKNAIDWVSRHRPSPFRGKFGLLLSASPSQVGGNRGLWQTRIPLEALGAHIYPDMFSLAKANEAFTEGGDALANEALQERLESLMASFVSHVKRCCGEQA